MANTIKSDGGRQTETVSVSLKPTEAEVVNVPLEGSYGQVDYLLIEQNITEVKEEPKLKVQLEDSIDNGSTWFSTEGASPLTEVKNVVVVSLVRLNLAGKPFGSLLRLKFTLGAKGTVVGTYTVQTDHA